MAATFPSLLPFSLLLLLLFSVLTTTTTATTTTSDADLLLTFKSSLQDPTSSLSNWSPSTPLCNWTGITCSPFSTTLTSINLQGLNLSGSITPSICGLPSLSHLSLAHNLFSTPIPLHLSQCTHLLSLNLSSNSLWGTIPDQLSLLSSLTTLDLSSNHLEGQIPATTLGSLHSLTVLSLASNWFTGTLHPSLFTNLTNLVSLDLSQNPSMASELPPEIGILGSLRWVLLQGSGFHGGIPGSFAALRELEVINLSRNNLTGGIPTGLGLGMGKLLSVDLSQNKLSGSFPDDVCNGKALVELSLHENVFTGSIDGGIGECSSLERFQVQDNGFSGDFPSGLWSLPGIKLIRAENNRFTGEMPSLVGLTSSLEQVQIDNNSFTGRIPQGLGSIHTMYRFSLSLNGFYGSLPENFCDSPAMSIINLSRNSLSGSIPELRNCRKLVLLSLAGNSFTGEIPASLAHLPVLTYIDLSSNRLSGEIPQELQNLKLALFNVSFNQLSGTVPSLLISDLPASFLQGNPDLCGPGLSNPCSELPKRKYSKKNGLIVAVIAIAFAAGTMVLAAGCFVVYRLSRRKSSLTCWKSVFFYPLRITEDELLMALDEKSVIGRGVFGKVHIVQLPGGEFVAVKRLVNSGKMLFRTVKAEMKMLAKARHKNIAKLLGFCYSEDMILLIHENIQRGSLGDAICRSDSLLDWSTRLQIALGTAQGLAYLHKDYVPKLLHRTIKSNNILLDADFEPKIMGFGIDRIIGQASYRSLVASELNPSFYMAPEYGCSEKATEQMDVYSFGVVLLELITGRQPEQLDSRESIDVVKWVRRKINVLNGSCQILDARISNSSEKEMLGVLEIALCCTSVMPDKRPTMPEVVRLLQYLDSTIDQPKFISV